MKRPGPDLAARNDVSWRIVRGYDRQWRLNWVPRYRRQPALPCQAARRHFSAAAAVAVPGCAEGAGSWAKAQNCVAECTQAGSKISRPYLPLEGVSVGVARVPRIGDSRV